ncbi:MAG: D-ribose pyranase [Deferribacterales bacterium]
MKKGILLNSSISSVISEMGHTDTLVIGDAGLPVPDGVRRIDLAVTAGVPDFATVLDAVLSELQIEMVTIADEIAVKNPKMFSVVKEAVDSAVYSQGKPVAVESVPHEIFKEMTKKAKAVIRTGETTPYSNIILHSGVVF